MREKKQALAVEWAAVHSVKPYEKNPRVIPQSAIEKVATSIRTFGWRQPIVVDKDRVIVVGHTRWLAAQFLKLKKIPVHVAEDLNEIEARAYRLADNRVGEETSWSPVALDFELRALGDSAFKLALTGFDPVELPSFEPTFAPVAEESTRRLDQTGKKPIACPSCGHHFTP